jgi:hypothetical protein
MCEKGRVAAFGDQAHVVSSLGKNDIIFLYHAWEGIVAAGKVTSGVKHDAKKEASYRDLEWLTAKPVKGSGKLNVMTPGEIKKLLGHDFFWARTIKVPYLTKSESENLLKALISRIGPKT